MEELDLSGHRSEITIRREPGQGSAGAVGRHGARAAACAGPAPGVTPLLPRAALVAVIAMATANRRLFDIGRLTFRVDWLGTALAVAVVVALLIAGRRIPRSAALAWFAAFVAVHGLSAWLNAGTWPRGYRFLVVYLCALAYVLAMVLLVQDRATARFAVGAFVLIVAAESLVGVGTLLVLNALALPSGAFLETGYQLPYHRARAFMSEPNLFASLLLAPFAIALWRFRGEGRRARWQGLLVAALTAGVVAGLTRIVWMLAAALVALWVWRVRPGRGKVAVVAAAAAATLVAVLVTELSMTDGDLSRGAVYRQTLRPAVLGRDAAVAGRVMELETGLASFLEQPLIGHGPGSTNRLEQYVAGGTIRRWRGWVANGTVFVLHDVGVVGLAALAGTVVATALACRRTAQALRDPADRADHGALALGLAGVLVAWQATHGFWQMYGYMAFGLLLALHAVARREAAAALPSASARRENDGRPESLVPVWLGAGSSCEPDEARGSQRREAYLLYVERRWRPSNDVWRRKLAQPRARLDRGGRVP